MLWGVVEIGDGNLHRNYTGWEELQYGKKLSDNKTEKVDTRKFH